MVEEVVPGEDALVPDASLGPIPDAVQQNEGTVEHQGVASPTPASGDAGRGLRDAGDGRKRLPGDGRMWDAYFLLWYQPHLGQVLMPESIDW